MKNIQFTMKTCKIWQILLIQEICVKSKGIFKVKVAS